MKNALLSRLSNKSRALLPRREFVQDTPSSSEDELEATGAGHMYYDAKNNLKTMSTNMAYF